MFSQFDGATDGKVVSYSHTDSGWFETTPKLYFMPDGQVVKLAPLVDGDSSYMHLATYNRTDLNTAAKQLTKGMWEVAANGVLGYNAAADKLYFRGTNNENGDAVNSFAYILHLETLKVERMTIASVKNEHAYYTATLSPKAEYVVLNYLGMDTPRQSIISTAQ